MLNPSPAGSGGDGDVEMAPIEAEPDGTGDMDVDRWIMDEQSRTFRDFLQYEQSTRGGPWITCQLFGKKIY